MQGGIIVAAAVCCANYTRKRAVHNTVTGLLPTSCGEIETAPAFVGLRCLPTRLSTTGPQNLVDNQPSKHNI
jgi:hypothetical protein